MLDLKLGLSLAKDQNSSENGTTSDACSLTPIRPILNWLTHVAASVRQQPTLFQTLFSQGCGEAANDQKPDIDVPQVHRRQQGGGGQVTLFFIINLLVKFK